MVGGRKFLAKVGTTSDLKHVVGRAESIDHLILSDNFRGSLLVDSGMVHWCLGSGKRITEGLIYLSFFVSRR